MKTSILISAIIGFIFYVSNSFSQVTFTDVAALMGVDDQGAAQGVIFVDVNNDGWLDIFLVNNNTPNKLWVNTSGTVFKESSSSWGVGETLPCRGLSSGDFNNDGFIDVMVGSWQGCSFCK